VQEGGKKTDSPLGGNGVKSPKEAGCIKAKNIYSNSQKFKARRTAKSKKKKKKGEKKEGKKNLGCAKACGDYIATHCRFLLCRIGGGGTG